MKVKMAIGQLRAVTLLLGFLMLFFSVGKEAFAQQKNMCILVVIDRFTGKALPDTKAIVAGKQTCFGGNNAATLFLPPGRHKIKIVTSAKGFEPRHDPKDRKGLRNPKNKTFGNPRYVTIGSGMGNANFEFFSYVKFRATVRDKVTGQPIVGAKAVFHGKLPTIPEYPKGYSCYPALTDWGKPFITNSQGKFPREIALAPPINGKVTISKEGYEDKVIKVRWRRKIGTVQKIGNVLLERIKE